MIGTLILGIFLSASKIVIIGFLILYFIQLSKLLKKGNKRLVIIGLAALITTVMLLTPKIKARFLEGLKFDLHFQPNSEVSKSPVFNNLDKYLISDLEIRYLFAKIGLFHFNDDRKWLFGYNVGDVQDYLDLYYMQYGLAPNWYEGYNLHNQYLQTLLSTGIFSLLFLLYYLISMFLSSIWKMNSMQLRFLIITILIFLFESVLMRNKGVVFFVYFSSLFTIENLRNENRNYRD
jgi:O-antigen ligase